MPETPSTPSPHFGLSVARKSLMFLIKIDNHCSKQVTKRERVGTEARRGGSEKEYKTKLILMPEDQRASSRTVEGGRG